ncbi:MAG: hypothetical protein C5B44_03990 [Acidobacteria bacterium]|nr:MAG: hypothetical protein C5B44_03990 [Acidobacteriota bacterium]
MLRVSSTAHCVFRRSACGNGRMRNYRNQSGNPVLRARSCVNEHWSWLLCVFFLIALVAFLSVITNGVYAQTRAVNLAVLDFGDSPFARISEDHLISQLKLAPGIKVLDRDATRVATRGAGYTGSLNLSLAEARDLGNAIGCDFYLLGDAQSLRRSTSTKPVYFEAYASIFLVSSRTGKLIRWERLSFEADDRNLAEENLFQELSKADFARRYAGAIGAALESESHERETALTNAVPVLEEAPDDEKTAEATGLRLPKPYRRLRPAYPDTAARADAAGIVDVLVDLDAGGEVVRADISRWAGFGLDEATIDTVRRLHFFPAQRNGTAIPIRILLRYNFRKSAQ